MNGTLGITTRRLALLAVALLGAGLSQMASAAFIANPGFETGSFFGWNVQNGSAFIRSATNEIVDPGLPGGGTPPVITASEGTYYAYLLARAQGDVFTRNPEATEISTGFSGSQGDVLGFDLFFDAGDYVNPGNDIAYVDMAFFGGNCPGGCVGTRSPRYGITVANVGDYGASGWKHYSITLPYDVSGVLWFGIANIFDDNNPSALAIDNLGFNQPSAVPLPAAVWLLLSGCAGVITFTRRRRPSAPILEVSR